MIGRTNTGGGSAFKAFLTATSDVGATITAVSNSTGKTKTYTGTVGSGGTVTLTIKAAGVYTVTASKTGENDVSTAVTIITHGQTYSCTLEFVYYLYNLGDECTSKTGGWSACGMKYDVDHQSMSTPTVSHSANGMSITQGGGGGAVYSANDIDFSEFATLKMEYDIVSGTASGWNFLGVYNVGISGGQYQAAGKKASVGIGGASGTGKVVSLSISALTDLKQIALFIYGSGAPYLIKKIWLE